MNRTWWIGVMLLAAAASSLVLPQLADREASLRMERGAVETFGGDNSTVLDNDNLVDVLGALPFTLSLASVGWENGVLSLDLKVTGSGQEPEDIYRNMAQAMSFAFQDTLNVKQLLLRIIVDDKWLASRRLLLAADIRRQEWTLGMQDELRTAGNHKLPQHLLDGFRISESELWKNQFAPG